MGRVSHHMSVRTHPRHCQVLWLNKENDSCTNAEGDKMCQSNICLPEAHLSQNLLNKKYIPWCQVLCLDLPSVIQNSTSPHFGCLLPVVFLKVVALILLQLLHTLTQAFTFFLNAFLDEQTTSSSTL